MFVCNMHTPTHQPTAVSTYTLSLYILTDMSMLGCIIYMHVCVCVCVYPRPSEHG